MDIIKMIETEPTSPLKRKPQRMNTYKKLKTLKSSLDVKNYGGTQPATTTSINKPRKPKEEMFKDFIQYFDTKTADEKFLNEGLGLLTLHAKREANVKHPTNFKLKEFKLPVSNLKKSDVAYFEQAKGVDLRPYYYDKKFKKCDEVVPCDADDQAII